MQFYLNGYTPGDPDIQDPYPGAGERPAFLPPTMDVLVMVQSAVNLRRCPSRTNSHDEKVAAASDPVAALPDHEIVGYQ